ncbi:MAG: glycoside hydrolase N-terminal domain-containing protein [Gemmatimonadales bacterium]|jgi:hypothetical protein
MKTIVRCTSAAVLLAIAPGLVAHPAAAQGLQVPERGFISSQPGESWEQGLITGNGTIGASMLSRPLDDVIVFSHERIFLPERPPLMPPDAGPRLFEIRQLIDRGLYQQATQLVFDISDQEGFRYPDPFVPAFDLSVRMNAGMEVRDYARSTNFETGEVTVYWADARGAFTRTLFVSRADGVAVLRITGPAPGAVNCRLEIVPRNPDHQRFRRNITDLARTAHETSLTYRHTYANAYPGSIHVLEGVADVKRIGGSATPHGSALVIEGADEVLVTVAVSPLYGNDETRLEDTRAALTAMSGDYDTLLSRHVVIHGELFNRMRLDLGGEADHGLTSEALIAKSTDEHLSLALVEKLFDAGRYNIISSTGELPPTLQGVWAGSWDPPWASDFTQNGNVPSAIASMMMANMPELMLAYTSYLEYLVPWLEINADRLFGARGIVLPSRTSTNGFNNAFAPRFAGAYWTAGAAWASHFFYDYWQYTGDHEFLAGHALPFMEKAALFFEDYLYEGPDGRWIFSPTASPENSPSNTGSQSTFNSTMSVAASKELLHNLIAGSRELGVNGDKIPVWQRMLAKMPEYLINEDGAVKEWLTPKLEDNYGHRHSSQLYPLFDGMPPEIAESPELKEAFRRVIELKLERHWTDWERRGGYMSFGLVQTGQAAASLGDADLAWRSFVPLINRYWLHNLASTHNYRELFNMDISGGMPAVLILMLVGSQHGEIRLLPAVPEAWPRGSIEGVLARGQIEIEELRWQPGVISVTLVSQIDQRVTLQAPSAIESVSSSSAHTEHTDREDSIRVMLSADQPVTLRLTLR